MNKVYLGIGTNIGDRNQYIKDALDAIAHLPGTEVTGVSCLYETEPWGYTEQDSFYNVCAEVETSLSPNGILGACLGIEAALGRVRTFRYAPRVIDIDVLLYNDIHADTEELTVPHPRIQERAFVLVPLKDVLPEMKIGDIDLKSAYEKCDKTGVKSINHIK